MLSNLCQHTTVLVIGINTFRWIVCAKIEVYGCTQTKKNKIIVLVWRENVDKEHKSFSSLIRALKKMSYLPPKLLKEIYHKIIIPRCIAVWGNCSVSMFADIDRLPVEAARIMHKIPQNISDCNFLECTGWRDLGYLCKRRLAIEVVKVIQGLNKR